MGSYAFEHFVPDESALLVERLLEAGAIVAARRPSSRTRASLRARSGA